MRRTFGNNSLRLLSSVMIMGILWLGIFSVIAMNHGGSMHAGCPMDFIGSNDGSQPIGSNFCTNIHMGMVQELSHAIPGNVDFGMGIASLIALAALLFARVRDGDMDCYDLSRVQNYERGDENPNSYFAQIKKWISLREERDPSYCLA